MPIRLLDRLTLLSVLVSETYSPGELGFQGADAAKLPSQFQVFSIHLVGEEEKDGGIHERPVLGCRFRSAPSEMSPEAARALFRIIILEGEGAERPEEVALRTEGTELSVTPEGKADALQGGIFSNGRDGLDEIFCPKLGREADADLGVDLEQTEARDVEAQSLEVTLPEEGVGEVGDDQLSCHRFLSLGWLHQTPQVIEGSERIRAALPAAGLDQGAHLLRSQAKAAEIDDESLHAEIAEFS
jgi:hypothetical protein